MLCLDPKACDTLNIIEHVSLTQCVKHMATKPPRKEGKKHDIVIADGTCQLLRFDL